MSTQSTVITLEQLAQDFDGLFRDRAFRLEAQDYYDAPNERGPYANFLAHVPVDPAWRDSWKRIVREIRASGRIMERVQVVTEPLGGYALFCLLHGKPASVEAGEDVRILSRSDARLLPSQDFWLFDEQLAAMLTYDDAGRIQRVELDNTPWLVDFLRVCRDVALRRATPLARYVAEHNIIERIEAA